MRQLIGLVLFALVFALACPSTGAEAAGPYDWNNFILEVQTTIKDVEVKKEKLEKEISTDPAKRSAQVTETQHMLDQIIQVQNMIDYEFKYRDQLDQTQKNLLESYKNKALRYRQELTDLKNKLQN